MAVDGRNKLVVRGRTKSAACNFTEGSVNYQLTRHLKHQFAIDIAFKWLKEEGYEILQGIYKSYGIGYG